ncbi:MAG: ABC transporter substrate-binding protein [Thermomicrobiales bacterium]|nr:ABC transporter substrate-binding protein [Thermomicrobiales bacterium]
MGDDLERVRSTLQNARQTRMSRRGFLGKSIIGAAGLTVLGGLLAACGGDDEETPAAATSTTAPESGAEPTSTEAAAEESPTEAPEATEATEEGSPEAEATEPGSPEAGGGTRIDGGDRLMGKDIEEPGQTGGTLIQADSLDIRTLNPILQNDVPSGNVISLILESMIETNPDSLEPTGNLAVSWEVNEDASEWTFYLRDGVTWHDGEPFTGQDVKMTYDLFMNPDSGSNQTSTLTSKIDTVELIDDFTVHFKLKLPVVDFPIDSGSFRILANHVWGDIEPSQVQQDPGSTGNDPSRVVGTGPFKFKEWITSDHVTLERNDDYWDGAPALDEFIYKIVPDTASAIQQLKTGEVDVYVGVEGSQVADFENTDVNIEVYPQLSFTFYGTNMDESITTKFVDAKVRQALMYALDRQAIVDNIYFGYGEVAIGTLPTASWAANPEGIEPDLRYDYDPDKANALLDEAGWMAGSDGVREKDGQRMSFDMYGISGNNIAVQSLQAMQEYWKAVGVEMTPQPEPFQQLVSRITETFDFEIFLVGFSWDATPDQSAMWACDSYKAGFNMVKYCNPEVDDLLKQAAAEPDKQKRIELYTEFQNKLLVDIPMGVTVFSQGITGVNKRVHNFFPSQQNTRFNAETWWVEQ